MQATSHESLLAALGIGGHDHVAFVGGGGKTSALQLLAEESLAARRERRILVTTTTAMFLGQLEATGPVVLLSSLAELRAELEQRLAGGASVAAALTVGQDEKVAGLPPEWVDQLWASGTCDHLFVEADGSRGASLKAFASHEPQVPATATMIVQVVGIDVLGAPLSEPDVHRAELLSRSLGVPLGSPVTEDMLAKALLEQLRVLGRHRPGIPIVTFLNKVESPESRGIATHVGGELLAASDELADITASYGVIAGSVVRRTFVRLAAREGAPGSSV